MKISKFRFVALVLISVLICGIVIGIYDVFLIKVKLDELYWVAENTPSFMAPIMIEIVESKLYQKQTILMGLAGLTALTVVSLMLIKRKLTDEAVRDKRIPPCFMAIFLTLVLLTLTVTGLTVSATEERNYARVQMTVPKDPWIGDLLDVSGHFTPDPTGVVQYWVAYHIAVAFPESDEWLGAGYYTDEVDGTLFYIEWKLDGYHQETTWPVTFGEQYWVSINWGDQGGVNPGAGWGAHIWDSYWNLIMEKNVPELPLTGINILCYAGGESVYTENPMSASFSDLEWTTYDDYNQDFWEGMWDDSQFSCAVIEHSPYSIDFTQDYYEFTVSGGTGRTLIIDADAGGDTIPVPGIYAYSYGATVGVDAFPDDGFDFRHWEKDGDKFYGDHIDVLMDDDHMLKAWFQYLGGGGGGCPMLSVYSRTGYVEEGLLEIHNPDGEDVVTGHVLINTPEPVGSKYMLRLTEHEQTYSNVDQVQLFATLTNGTEVKLPLVSAIHSEDGNVKQELLVSDDVRAVMLGADWNNGTSQYIDLKFVAPDELEIETFTFTIEGHNIPLKIP